MSILKLLIAYVLVVSIRIVLFIIKPLKRTRFAGCTSSTPLSVWWCLFFSSVLPFLWADIAARRQERPKTPLSGTYRWHTVSLSEARYCQIMSPTDAPLLSCRVTVSRPTSLLSYRVTISRPTPLLSCRVTVIRPTPLLSCRIRNI